MTTPLRKVREKRGASTYEVAAAVNINQSQYSRVECGKRRPSPDLASRIAKYFGNAVIGDQILFPEDYMQPEQPPKKPIPQRLRKAS
jgi:transcriptional regulator with XRE-family HTH domain